MTDIGIYDVNYLDLDLYFQWHLLEKKTNIDLYFQLATLTLYWERKTGIDIYNSIKQCC